jgi:hypothetical protein
VRVPDAKSALGQVLLDEPGTEMDIDLNERRVASATEAMDLAGLDDQNVTCAGFEFLTVDDPKTTTFPHELDFIVGMTMRPGTMPREGTEEEHGDIHVAVIGPNELVRAAHKRQVLLTDAVHLNAPLR